MMAASDSQSCSIVIRAYNEEQHIGRLLDGILQQTLPEPEIILVDSGSYDRTAVMAEQRGARVLHLQPELFSFGRSLNLGLAAAHNDLVVIASAHVYPVYPDWLERLLAPFTDSRVGLCYGKQRGGAATRYSEHQVFARWFPEQSNFSQPHPFCNNANAAIRRTLWEQHKYDENLTGLEDLAWARWLTEQSYNLAYVAEAEVIHVHHESWKAVFNRYRREAMAYKHLYPSERFSLSDFFQLTWGNIINDARLAFRERRLPRYLTEIFLFRLMQFWGTYQGYRHPGPVTEQLRRTFYYPHHSDPPSPGTRREVEPIRYGNE